MQKIQNFAARISVGGMRRYDQISPAFEELRDLRSERDTGLISVLLCTTPWGAYYLIGYTHFNSCRCKRKCNQTAQQFCSSKKKVSGSKMWNSLPAFFFFFFLHKRKQLKGTKKKARYSLLLPENKYECSKRVTRFMRRDALTLSSWKSSSHRQREIQTKEDCSRVYQ